MTPALTPGFARGSPFERTSPSANRPSARARAAVMRCGGGPASRTPTRSRAGPEMFAHAQRHAQHHAARGQRVARHPIDELAHLGLERRHVELAVDILQAVVQARIGIRVVGPDHAGGLAARAQRHGDHVAGRKIEPGRHPIGIGLVERHRHQNIDNTCGHGERLADSGGLRKGEESGATLRAMSETTASPDVAAEIARWLSYLGAERRMSAKTLEPIAATSAQFLGFLAGHLGGSPSLQPTGAAGAG